MVGTINFSSLLLHAKKPPKFSKVNFCLYMVKVQCFSEHISQPISLGIAWSKTSGFYQDCNLLLISSTDIIRIVRIKFCIEHLNPVWFLIKFAFFADPTEKRIYWPTVTPLPYHWTCQQVETHPLPPCKTTRTLWPDFYELSWLHRDTVVIRSRGRLDQGLQGWV